MIQQTEKHLLLMAATFVKFVQRLILQFGSETVQILFEQCVHWFVRLAKVLCMTDYGEFVCEGVLALNMSMTK